MLSFQTQQVAKRMVPLMKLTAMSPLQQQQQKCLQVELNGLYINNEIYHFGKAKEKKQQMYLTVWLRCCHLSIHCLEICGIVIEEPLEMERTKF